MKVYRGTMTKNKTRRNSAVEAAAAGRSFICFLNAICCVGTLVALTVGIFLYYMSLVRDIRHTSRQIELTRQEIAETNRSLKTLSNENSRLSSYAHITQKVRQFRLPLVIVEHRQVRQINMEILTPLQASLVKFPVQSPVAVAGNISRTKSFRRF